MTTITCKRCGLSFQTEATTNTRCRRCRVVVPVPAAARNVKGSRGARSNGEHTFGVVLLSCGHPAAVVVHPGRSLARILKQVEWECPDTDASVTATGVLAVLSKEEYESMTDNDIDFLVSSISIAN